MHTVVPDDVINAKGKGKQAIGVSVSVSVCENILLAISIKTKSIILPVDNNIE